MAHGFGQNVFQIAEFSECAGMIGLPWDVWAVREFLPTIPIGVCERYGNMPVCREFRYFIKDGRYVCSHPYWPADSLVDGGFDISQKDFDDLCKGRTQETDALALAAGQAMGGGSWSVDVLETKRGWYVTDMEKGRPPGSNNVTTGILKDALLIAAAELGEIKRIQVLDKHNWESTCFVSSLAELEAHVYNIAEFIGGALSLRKMSHQIARLASHAGC